MKVAVALIAVFAVSCQAMMNGMGQGSTNQGGRNPLMTRMLMQKLRGGNSNQGGQGGQGGSAFPAAMMPLILGSDRGTKMLATSMAMKNPAMLQAIMLNGGMSDNMARSLAMMGMFQGENGAANGQQNQQMIPLMYAMSGNQEMSSMFPFLMGSTGAGNGMNAGAGKAGAGAGGQAGGASNMMDAMLLSGIF